MSAKINLTEGLLAERAALGVRIRTLRTHRGWSQEQLAERAGLDRQTIGRIELSTRGPSIDAYLVVAQALGVPTAWLFRDE
jgi:transcriptional regulator with XRE-family HTH domain